MYKVFIVDDEEYVVKSLKARINWKEHGFEVVGYSFSSDEALKEIIQLKPDLVFTDIRMPGMSGLELIKSIKESGLNTLSIVISGYAEFAYAQKALNYGAFGYCLKPFDDTEIIDFLEKAKTVIANSKISTETRIMDLIEEDSLESREDLRNLLKNYGIDLAAIKAFFICVSVGKEILEIEGIHIRLTLKIGYDKYAYFLVYSENSSVQTVLDDIGRSKAGHVGLSGPVSDIGEMKAALRQAEISAYNYFCGCKNIFASSDSLQLHSKETYIRQLEEAIGKNDIQSAIKVLDSISPVFAAGELNIKHAIIIYNKVMAFSFRLKNEHFEDYIYHFDKLSAIFGGVRQMLNYLRDILSRKFDMDFKITAQNINNQSVRLILKYVNDHFTEDISVQSISKHFNINANYISKLFKKEVGIVFTEYLARLRICLACSLLKTTEMSIGEISEKVGYNDYFYFSRVFKKMKGKSPSAYRTGIDYNKTNQY